MTYIKGRIKSFNNASRGIIQLFKRQQNARLQLLALVIVAGLGFIAKLTSNEWSIILLAIGLVLMAEALNTAIEYLADEVTQEYNEKIKLIKDISAGAVLITAIISVIIGCIIFVPKLFCAV
ncbi:MAG TPA: diacylglycerol kinase family protein [Flavobacteriales bacterium]|nr:diacylglycerol kinase family protein [Flavobacteriales bacterium]HIN40030.1 diacylglycerol kinase family protein [Flavobacteriales bacterium]